MPVASWRAREPISQTIKLLAPVGNVLFGEADVAQANLRMQATVRPQAGAAPIPAAQAPAGTPPVEFTIVRAARDLDNGDSYTFVSAATKASIQDLENASTDYPAEIQDKFLQIPPEFSPRVRELAQQLTANAATPYEKAKAIESYLRTLPYDDAIAAPPAGVDPLEYFLFDIKRGYCDYYATAMAMMLRTVGVPARTASGYAEGLFDEESQSYYITQRDAHTWVEVFFPEYGWIEFEPTAGESPLDRPQNGRRRDGGYQPAGTAAREPLGTDTAGPAQPRRSAAPVYGRRTAPAAGRRLRQQSSLVGVGIGAAAGAAGRRLHDLAGAQQWTDRLQCRPAAAAV